MDLSIVPPRELRRLAETLWDERLVLEQLLYRLTCAKLLLTADTERFVPRAMDEVEVELERLRATEVARACVVQELEDLAGLGDRDLTLDDLVSGTDDPWPRVFGNLQRAFRELADEIDAVTATNHELANRGLARVRASMAALAGDHAPAPLQRV